MRAMTLALLLLVAGALGGRAYAVEWQGDLIVTSVAGCEDHAGRGQYFYARFTPANIGGNGPDSYLTLFHHVNALSFLLPNASVTGAFQNVQTMTIFQTHFPIPVAVGLRFTSIVPAITATTPNLQIVGQIRGFGFDVDCVATFRLALVRVLP